MSSLYTVSIIAPRSRERLTFEATDARTAARAAIARSGIRAWSSICVWSCEKKRGERVKVMWTKGDEV